MTNPSELVERLNDWPAMPDGDALAAGTVSALMTEAASEITRLRGLLEAARAGLSEFPNISGDPKVEALASSLLKRLEGE